MSAQGDQLKRILVMLTLLGFDIEWFALGLPPEKAKKWQRTYKEKAIDWVKRDILTSTARSEIYEEVFRELNSDKIKDLTEWLTMGIECTNLDEVIAALKECETKVESAA